MTISFLRHLPGLNGLRLQPAATTRDLRLATAQTVLDQLLAQLPELLVAVILDISSGLPLASYATERRYQSATVLAAVVAAVRQVQASLVIQEDAPAGQLREVLLTLSNQLHLSCLGASGQLIYLAVDAYDTNLALARQLGRQAINDFDSLQ